MELFYREVGSGFPVVILHGLYGSSDNWLSIAKQIGESYRVILVDHRNHGNSPKAHSHTYNDLANDLYDLVRRLDIDKFHLIGHSMGGRAAMLFQTLYPNFVRSLIVVDVAPWSYSGTDIWFVNSYSEHKSIIRGMKSLPLSNINSRSDADKLLSASIHSEKLRQFLFKNLRRDSQGKFYWSINLDVLESSLEEMVLGIDVDKRVVQELDVLFIKGEDSNYIPKRREYEIFEIYPKAKLIYIKNAGHWVHAEQPAIFVNEVLQFLSRL
jgi:pimeloyl-ACP methyl ester carboxylesterase